MLFTLERVVFQGIIFQPQYCWTQYARCGNGALLERIRQSQRHPEEWRVCLFTGSPGQTPNAA